MNFKLYKYKSETELFIYDFFYCDFNNTFKYEGFQISRRNDKNDIWGHQWSDHFHAQKYKEQAEYEEANDYYPDNWDNNPLEEGYLEIAKKYNPIRNKTKAGEPYLEGMFSKMRRNLPKPEFTEEELLDKLKKAVADKLKSATLQI